MGKLLKSVAMLLALAALYGCASGPKFSEVAPTLSATPTDYGRIYFYRVTILGAALQPDVKLNGEVVGKSVAQGFFHVDRPAGNYEVVTSTEVDRSLSFTLASGQTRYVRFDVSFGFFVGHVYPELVEPDVGVSEIVEMHYTGAAS